MSIKVMTLVWEHSQHKGGDLLTLLAIADHADDHGVAYPSIDALAKKTRMKRRNTVYVVHRLEESSELKIEHNAGPSGVHKYRINLDLLKKGGAKIARAKIAQMQKRHVQPIAPKPSSYSSSSDSKKNPQSQRATKRAPEDFELTEDMRTWAKKNHPAVNYQYETEKFKDHTFKTARSDWLATWRNWIRRADEPSKNGKAKQEPLMAYHKPFPSRSK